MKKEDLKPYQMAQQLRSAANRCTRLNADVAMLREHALAAASWLEKEAEDIAKLTGSVTHNAVIGRITPGCIIHETPNAQVTGSPALSASPRGLPGYTAR
jgi:hypothetical protein